MHASSRSSRCKYLQLDDFNERRSGKYLLHKFKVVLRAHDDVNRKAISLALLIRKRITRPFHSHLRSERSTQITCFDSQKLYHPKSILIKSILIKSILIIT